eukprot:4169084-Karenia_brevis.AAC.1
MYGMRGAASAWERQYAGRFSSIGFERGVSCGVVFYHRERDTSLVAHGDDFTFCGTDRDLKRVRKYMEEWYEIKVRAILCPEISDDKEVVILGKIVRWTDQGIEYEAEPKHRRIVLEDFDFSDDSKSLSINGDREDKIEEWEKQLLDKREAKEYRGGSGKVEFYEFRLP